MITLLWFGTPPALCRHTGIVLNVVFNPIFGTPKLSSHISDMEVKQPSQSFPKHATLGLCVRRCTFLLHFYRPPQ